MSLVHPPHSAFGHGRGSEAVESWAQLFDKPPLELLWIGINDPRNATASKPFLDRFTIGAVPIVAVEELADLLEEHRRLPITSEMLSKAAPEIAALTDVDNPVLRVWAPDDMYPRLVGCATNGL
jgi:hypothetical protein